MRRKRIKMQFKRWLKYSLNDQERIIKRYNVILLGHKTTKEKLMGLFKKSNKERNALTKVNLIIDKIISGINKFSNATNKIHLNYSAGDRRLDRITHGLNKASGVNHDYSILSNRKQSDYRI